MKPFDDIQEQLNRLFTESNIAPEVQRRFRTQFEAWLSKLNIVSREEFDAQSKVLAAALTQLQRLEQEIEELKSRQNSVD